MLAPRKPDHFELQGRKAKAPSQISFWHLLPDPFRHFRERPKAQNFPHYPCYMGNELSNMYTIPQNRYPAVPYTLEFSHASPLKMYKEKKTVSESSNCGKLGHWSVRTSRWCFRSLNPSPAIQDCLPGSCEVTQRQEAFHLMEPSTGFGWLIQF